MAGYIGSKSSVTLVDGYTEAEADAEFVNDPNGAITVDGDNVLIGTDTGDAFNADSRLRIGNSGDRAFLQFKTDASNNSGILFGTEADDVRHQIVHNVTDDALTFIGNSAEAMRIDSSGNVGIGTSSPVVNLHTTSGVARTSTAKTETAFFSTDDTDDFRFGLAISHKGGTTGNDRYASLDSTSYQVSTDTFSEGGSLVLQEHGGSVGIGISSTSARLEVAGSSNSTYLIAGGDDSSNGRGLTFTSSASANFNGSVHTINAPSSQGVIALSTHDTERMRIDSSGNLLVGTTDSPATLAATSSSEGLGYDADDFLVVSRGGSSGQACLILNKLTSDGDIVALRKDGATVGSIGNWGTGLYIGSPSASDAYLYFGNSYVAPSTTTGFRDNAIDLGNASARFDDIYATNSTINTSDFNDKQDIASLTATEMLVGKRISELFKTFRWKDSVEENGANARTHTGVIAQDVQAAFTAEGLDAGDYSLFISNTWWEQEVEVPAVEAVAEVTDEDGNVTTEAVEAVDAYTRTDTYDTEAEAPEGATERTRLGIRYPELLSFVAAYNEQRFASIEARLTALEDV